MKPVSTILRQWPCHTDPLTLTRSAQKPIARLGPWYIRLVKTLLTTGFVSGMSLLAMDSVQAADVTFDFRMTKSGTAPFSANDLAGNDTNDTNNIIRTQDIITYSFTYGVVNGSVNNPVFTAIVPANAELTLPPICAGTGSGITTDSSTGEQTIICKLSNSIVSGSAGSIDIKARVLTQTRGPNPVYVNHGDKTRATGTMAGDGIDTPIAPITTADLTISAAPKVDLYTNYAWVEGVAKGDDGITDGLVVRYGVAMSVTGSGKGSEALVGNQTFTSTLVYNGGANSGQPIPGVKSYTWRPDFSSQTLLPSSTSGCNAMGVDRWSYAGGKPNGKIGVSFFVTPRASERSTADSGTWTCSQSTAGTAINMTVTGADTRGDHNPRFAFDGNSTLAANETYLAVGTITMWVPVAAIVNNGGTLNVRNQLSNLTATGGSNQPNVEPSLTNNYLNHTLVGVSGSFSSAYATSVDSRATPLPYMSAIRGGDGVVLPGQLFALRYNIFNNGALAWDANSILCTTVDRETQELVPLTVGSTSAVKNFSSSNITLNTDYVIEYGMKNFSTPNDHRLATCRNEDSSIGWSSTLTSGANLVRVRMLQPIPPTSEFDIALNLKARNTYLTSGTSIPVGSKLVENSSFYLPGYPHYQMYGLPSGWSGGVYNPDTNDGVGWGDRLTLTRAIARIDRQNVPNNPTINAVAGNEVNFVLKSSLTVNGGDGSSTGNVTIVDVLPAYLDYVPGSANVLPTSIVTNGDGTKTITWDLGLRVVNQPIPDITYRATIRPDTPNNTTAITQSIISSPEDGSLLESRTDTTSLNVGNASAFVVFKEVDRILIDRNAVITYTLNYANSGATDLGPSDFIDILPFVGDGRTPATNFVGTSYFTSITAGSGETFQYTKAAPASISPDPNHVSNQSGGTTIWCNTIGSGAGCPQSNNEVTAVRIYAPAFPQQTSTRKIVLKVQTNSNQENNYYTNIFTGRNSSLSPLLESLPVFSKVKIPAKMLLVKRITKVGNTTYSQIVDDPQDTKDNNAFWPANYLKGAIDNVKVKPGDEVEYTIYYLSAGDAPITQSKICDLIPTNTDFASTVFNGLTPAGAGGTSGADLNIRLDNGSTTEYLTGLTDGDKGTYFLKNVALPTESCPSPNTNGAILVNMGTVAHAGYGGVPASSYGFVRFRVKVK
jgi:uncharacterized repeat protein (TIGR01451 family)